MEDSELEAWLADIGRTLSERSVASTPIVAVDVASGRVLGQTPSVADVLGCPVPDRIRDLVELGVVARPDLDALEQRVAGISALPALPGLVGGEAAHSWSAQIRVHPTDAPSRSVELQVAQHRRPGLGAEVLWITCVPIASEPEAPVAVPGLTFTCVHDRQTRLVAVSPEAQALWHDLDSLLGTVATALLHPNDLPLLLPAANAVFNGNADRASYTARVAADGGRWVRLRVDVERVIVPDGHLLVSRNEVIDEERRTVPVGVLSTREHAVVVALFDGLRVRQIAERDGVAAKTVRNQLVSAYRKLGVSGQEELLATYLRPNRR